MNPLSNAWRRGVSTAFDDLWHIGAPRRLPWYAHWPLIALTGAGVGAAIVFLVALFSGHLLRMAWWSQNLAWSILTGVIILLLLQTSFIALSWVTPSERLVQWREGQGRSRWLAYIGVPALCSVLSLILLDVLMRSAAMGSLARPRLPDYGLLITFLGCGTLLAGLSWWRLRAQLQAHKVRQQMTEAQLRLLQAQIEPHFLFNTLANVQGLIDYEPALAKRMLDAFTDYLRASLLQMRAQDVSLGEEFDLVQSYLTVMQCRMGERLRWRLDIPAELRAARIPPLLLQPLIENAIHHGLEPQIGGGQLVLRARFEGQGLCIEIDDDGIGLAAAQLRPRRGNGVALQNIRERLRAAYGPEASLQLKAGANDKGTRVCLTLSRLHQQTTPAI
ncbi:sensor histidine kinase [Roseateles oligotrophus]|uniref:Histidine kinase n=1 Tax=Roseateles oligotrophus TaxID=1769250 RepID=A0ABT2YBY0_9BURK|nr:histidine kinase [Roseateles oligotrophus]MCV2366995.1 histidine kinase [Roseateles oligotrophus]